LPAQMPPDEPAQARAEACGDEGALQLPLLGLYADLELGIGSVGLPDEFGAVDPGRRLLILRDWARGLEQARARALQDLMAAIDRDAPAEAPAARRARFAQACAALGIARPGQPLDGEGPDGERPSGESPDGKRPDGG
jgi:hypothetical protein